MSCNFCKKCIVMAEGANKKHIRCTSCNILWVKKVDGWHEYCIACEENREYAESLEMNLFRCAICNRYWTKNDENWISHLIC